MVSETYSAGAIMPNYSVLCAAFIFFALNLYISIGAIDGTRHVEAFHAYLGSAMVYDCFQLILKLDSLTDMYHARTAEMLTVKVYSILAGYDKHYRDNFHCIDRSPTQRRRDSAPRAISQFQFM